MLRLLSRASDYLHRKHVGNLAVVLEGQRGLIKHQTVPRSHESSFVKVLDIGRTDSTNSWSPQERELLDGVSCYMALPDYEFCYSVLPSTKLPENKSSVDQFVKWRVEQELGEIQKGCEVAIGKSSGDGDSTSILMLEAPRYREVTSLITSVNAQPKELLPLGFYIVERLRRSPQFWPTLRSSKVLIFLWDSFWSFIVMSENCVIVQYRSCRWSSQQNKAEELRELVSEFRRPIGEASGAALLVGARDLCDLFQASAELEKYATKKLDQFVFGDGEQARQENEVLDSVLLYES